MKRFARRFVNAVVLALSAPFAFAIVMLAIIAMIPVCVIFLITDLMGLTDTFDLDDPFSDP